MSPCPSAIQLDKYAAGELPPSEVEAIDRHAQECLACAERLACAPPFERLVEDVKEASQAETVVVEQVVHVQPSPPEQDPLIGQVIGDFEVRRLIGSGGMGTVYEAEQISLKRRVALKVLHAPVGARTAGVLRFGREAQAAARLHHTNIVSVFAQGRSGPLRYYAMEMIDGTGLDQIIREMRRQKDRDRAGAERGPTNDPAVGMVRRPRRPSNRGEFDMRRRLLELDRIDPRKRFDLVARLVANVADALDYAHQQGVIHRDVKPGNMILSADGRLSLTDFGLARMLEHPGMTIAGEFLGSPLYMSPEQVAAGRVPVDHRTDIYSLGASLYEMLCLRPPYSGETREQVISQIREGKLVRPRKINRRIPRDLETVCLKAMQVDPNHRYQTAQEMADDLRRFADRFAIRARRASLLNRAGKFVRRHSLETAMLGAILVVLMAAGLIAIHYQRQINEYAEELYRNQEYGDEMWKNLNRLRVERALEEGHRAVAFCRFREARQAFAEVTRLAKNDPVGYLTAGLTGYLGEIVGVEAGRSGFAEEFRKALELPGPRPPADLQVIRLLTRLPPPSQVSRMRDEELAPLLLRARQITDASVRRLTHGNGALLYVVLSWVALAGGQKPQALELAHQALDVQPNLALGYFIRAVILVAMGQVDEARVDARLAVRLLASRRYNQPGDLAVNYFLRAAVLKVLDLPDEALRQSRMAMEVLAGYRSPRPTSMTTSGPRPTSVPSGPPRRVK